jgi:hypothetical protein
MAPLKQGFGKFWSGSALRIAFDGTGTLLCHGAIVAWY